MILIDMILYDLDFKFKVIVITESKLNTKKTVKKTHQQNQKKVVLYFISQKKLDYINRQDLNINKDGMLESVFIEVLSKSNKNTIIGCICKHPKMAIADFTQNFIQPLLDKFSFENKNIILLGDFNIDLLHYENENQTRIFLDYMYSSSLSPHKFIHSSLALLVFCFSHFSKPLGLFHIGEHFHCYAHFHTTFF